MAQNTVPLNRALSKLGLLSRAQAGDAIAAGRVRVDGRLVTDPATRIVPERARIEIDDASTSRREWRTILFHKPRGVVTTRRDPGGRRTIYDVLGDAGRRLIAVGRLDLASSGLLLMTTDTQLANWITDPVNAVPRVYVVTVRGRVEDDRLPAEVVTVRKRSARNTHLIVELRHGKNREIRRLFEAIGHEVTRLKRVSIGGLELGGLMPGEWQAISQAKILAALAKSPRHPR